jgi:molybdate transport system substrate-binding protein
MMRFTFFWLGLLSLILGLAACGAPTATTPVQTQAEAVAAPAVTPTTLTVFAAASLTEPFGAMARVFEEDHPGVELLLNFAGSQALRLQIEQGARADVFASANVEHAEALLRAGLIERPIIFTHNQLVVIVPATNPGAIERLADLARPGLKLVLAGPNVPVGRYARQSLELLDDSPVLGANYSSRVLSNLVSEEDNVKGVVAKVRFGEADAGIVYVSDITPDAAADVSFIEIPPEFNIVADYPIARVVDAQAPEPARQFIEFVLSPRGQMILADHGFQPAGPAPVQYK